MTLHLSTASKSRGIIVLFKLFASVSLLALSSAAHACPVPNENMRITINGHKLNAEFATNRAGHMCGLAFRKELPADRGMLFAYAQDQVLGFWMKNTYIDLSIAFMDSDGRILEIHAMNSDQPTRRYISTQPARYALEVNQGWFSGNDIKVGDRVEINLSASVEIYRN